MKPFKSFAACEAQLGFRPSVDAFYAAMESESPMPIISEIIAETASLRKQAVAFEVRRAALEAERRRMEQEILDATQNAIACGEEAAQAAPALSAEDRAAVALLERETANLRQERVAMNEQLVLLGGLAVAKGLIPAPPEEISARAESHGAWVGLHLSENRALRLH